jgi:hypothetical protein
MHSTHQSLSPGASQLRQERHYRSVTAPAPQDSFQHCKATKGRTKQRQLISLAKITPEPSLTCERAVQYLHVLARSRMVPPGSK